MSMAAQGDLRPLELYGSTFCSNSTGLCRLTLHAVLLASPCNPLQANFTGAAELMLDGRPVSARQSVISEHHLVDGFCAGDGTHCIPTGVSEKLTWGLDRVGGRMPATSPRRACGTFTVSDLSDNSCIFPTAAVCANLLPAQVVAGGASGAARLIFEEVYSAATRLCDASRCRIAAHVVFRAVLLDPTRLLHPGGLFSLDEGATWLPSPLAFFAQDIAQLGSSMAQRFHFDVDLHLPANIAASTRRVCFRVWVTDEAEQHTRVSTLSAEGAVTGSLTSVSSPAPGIVCLSLCDRLAHFHTATGAAFCPNAEPRLSSELGDAAHFPVTATWSSGALLFSLILGLAAVGSTWLREPMVRLQRQERIPLYLAVALSSRTRLPLL